MITLPIKIINLLEDVNICEGRCPHCPLTPAGEKCLCEKAGEILDRLTEYAKKQNLEEFKRLIKELYGGDPETDVIVMLLQRLQKRK